MELSSDIHRWNPAMAGAFKKGADAHQNGQSITDCPYKDNRREDGSLGQLETDLSYAQLRKA